jgi:hypothetical protein
MDANKNDDLINFDMDLTPPEINRRIKIVEEDIELGVESLMVDIGILDLGHRVTKQRQIREEEYGLRQRLLRIKNNLKKIAHLYLAFSIYLILNDCIGLSSAPFYITDVKCKILEPTEDC